MNPVPPSPIPCPSCGISEATAVCRWCGVWKFGKEELKAAQDMMIFGTGALMVPSGGGTPYHIPLQELLIDAEFRKILAGKP